MEITLKDVQTAYRKLKSLAYYDTYDLFLRSKISSYEVENSYSDDVDKIFRDLNNIDQKLSELHKALTVWDDSNKERYWEERLEKIGYKVLPKKMKPYGKYKDNKSDRILENVFTNVREIEDGEYYEFEKLTFYIDCPVEIHIVSILWIMKLGYKLEEDLDDKCYGNRLILEKNKVNSEYRETLKDESLFKPYYLQYQKWRDEGIMVAKQYLDKNQDVLFINIDIKDYYYSVQLDFESLNQRLGVSEGDKNILLQVFENTHHKYTRILDTTNNIDFLDHTIINNKSLLPIGLASSYVLGNWYLYEFDHRVNQNIRPLYYSRYVDDIFIVTSNPDPRFINDMDCDYMKELFSKTYSESLLENISATEKYILKSLFPVIVLDEKSKEVDSESIFKISCFDNLYIQPSKTIVYLFNHNSSLALLDKFINELEKRSSEFRFLPDEKIEENGFDDEAYELVFDDSLHKIKTLKDYKESRFGIASYLSKKIFYSLRNGKKNSKEDAQKIITFFKGTTNIDHYRQWERILTYFVVNDNKEEFIQFVVNTYDQIFKLPLSQSIGVSYVRIAADMIEYFSIAMEMALALNPKFLHHLDNKIKKILSPFKQEIQNTAPDERPLKIVKNIDNFRRSNLIRHSYVSIPLLNYTQLSGEASLLDCDFSKISCVDEMEYDVGLLKYSPRKVRFYEVAWMECIKRVHETKKVERFRNKIQNDILYNRCNGDQVYLDSAFDIYYEINYWYNDNDNFKDELKREIFSCEEMIDDNGFSDENHEFAVVADEIAVNNDPSLKRLRVGLANLKVDEYNYETSMLGKPNLKGRYSDFAKVLNEAEQEKCQLVVLPELSLPHGLVKTVIDHSWKHDRAIVSGIEHWTYNDVVYNFIMTVLPCSIRGIKDAVPIIRLKNHYAPAEEFWINDYRRVVPKQKPYRYHLLRWKGLYFTNYYCFELADIIHRSIFRSKIDFIVASEWNSDINYYSNITELTARDIHCYFIQVNTSQYGDSRVTKPTKTVKKDSLRIKGGLNTTLLVDELDIDSLRKFQYKGFGQQKDDKEFKPTPADYRHEDARMRMDNCSFKKDNWQDEKNDDDEILF